MAIKLYKKLQWIQEKLKAPKEQYNSFGRYNYRNCEDILEALKPLMVEVDVTLTIGDSVELIGTRFYIKSTVRLIDIESDEIIENVAYAREEESKKGMDGSQVTGASSSYARKYALNGLFCIDDVKDSDTTNVGDGKSENKGARENDKKIAVILVELARTGIGRNAILKNYKADDFKYMTIEQMDDCIARLKAKPDKTTKKTSDVTPAPTYVQPEDDTSLPWN